MSRFDLSRQIGLATLLALSLATPLPAAPRASEEGPPGTDLTLTPPGSLSAADVIEALSPLRGTVIKPRRSAQLPVFFASNSAELTPEARRALEVVAVALAAPGLAGLTFQVVGHSDHLGPSEENERLSKMRAEVVRYYLIAHGVPAERLAVDARGESEPIAPGETPAERHRNRRVELTSLAMSAE